MKTIELIILLMLFLACENQNKSAITRHVEKDTLIRIDTFYLSLFSQDREKWKDYIGKSLDPDKDSIWNKQVSYYINDPECSGLAEDFYYGLLRPSDNGTTMELLKLACSPNNKLRPFYRWCLNTTVYLSDGALAENVGLPARQYAEKFPKEFFKYMDTDSSKNKYQAWIRAINYSGYFDSNNSIKAESNSLIATMKGNCTNCDSYLLKRIETFGKDCFQ